MAIKGMFWLPSLFSAMLASLDDLTFFKFLSVFSISASNGSISTSDLLCMYKVNEDIGH